MIAQDVPAEIAADPSALYQAAVRDRQAGRHQEAVAHLDLALAIRPDDVDARLQRGLSLLSLGRLDEAEADLTAVLTAAPDYADARVGLARVAQARGDIDRARMEADRAAQGSPERDDIQAFARSLRGPPRWRVDLDLSRSQLGAGLEDWREARLGLVRRMDPAWTAGASAEWSERFGDADVYLEGRVDRRLGAGSIYVAAGGAPDADYRPEFAVRAGGERPLSSVLSASLDASASRFAVGTVTSLEPGLAVDFDVQGMRLAGRWINVWDESGQRRSGYAFSVQWAATDGLRLRLDGADAPETSEGVTVDVQTFSVSAEWSLTQQFAVRATALHEDRGAYERDAIGVGLGWRFW